jgi:hypothetical protein
MLGLFALLLQGLAPLCFATSSIAQSGSFIVICTAQGMQTIRVDGDGHPLPNAPAQDHANSPCVLCTSAHHSAGFIPPDQVALLVLSVSYHAPLPADSVAPARPPHISYVSRAPPSAYA